MIKRTLDYIKHSIFIATLLFLSISSISFAEIKTFEKEYTYQASDEDSKNSCRVIALREVKRLLLEQLGTYLESIVEVKNFQLTKDQITTLTAGIVSADIVDEKWDGKTYRLKARISSDPSHVIKSIDKLRKDRAKTKELEQVRKESERLKLENERLKKELLTAKGKKRQEAVKAYKRTIGGMSAQENFEKGLSLSESGNYVESIEYFNGVVELDPKFAWAYLNRGAAYGSLGNYRQAIRDFNRAIELDLKDALAYYNRGTGYSKLGNYQQAIGDYDRAIELDPKYVNAYCNSGLAYWELGNYKQAISDLKIAARLGDSSAHDFLRKRGINW